MKQSPALMLNILALYVIAGVLIAAFAMQFWLSELPCPLCLLQRAFICALAAGPILNLRYGPRPSHYALSILALVVMSRRAQVPAALMIPYRRGER